MHAQGCLCLVTLFVLPTAAMSVCLLSTTVDNGRLELQLDLTSTRTGLLKVLDDLHAFLIRNLTKDNMFAVQPGSDDGGDEELRAIAKNNRQYTA
jgi:hypothetical protein